MLGGAPTGRGHGEAEFSSIQGSPPSIRANTTSYSDSTLSPNDNKQEPGQMFLRPRRPGTLGSVIQKAPDTEGPPLRWCEPPPQPPQPPSCQWDRNFQASPVSAGLSILSHSPVAALRPAGASDRLTRAVGCGWKGIGFHC